MEFRYVHAGTFILQILTYKDGTNTEVIFVKSELIYVINTNKIMSK